MLQFFKIPNAVKRDRKHDRPLSANSHFWQFKYQFLSFQLLDLFCLAFQALHVCVLDFLILWFSNFRFDNSCNAISEIQVFKKSPIQVFRIPRRLGNFGQSLIGWKKPRALSHFQISTINWHKGLSTKEINKLIDSCLSHGGIFLKDAARKSRRDYQDGVCVCKQKTNSL